MLYESTEKFIAVRSREQIAAEAAELARRCQGPAAEAAGALAVYRWVLNPRGSAPVTGRAVDTPLADLDLVLEERAAIRASRDRSRSGPERDRAAGAARALGWVLGFVPMGR
ncbi:hypothetical protein [Kitasatospora sp. NPDC090091]|uniref:hypothetical protein n=1 Tax=Kitasatospora sp. NPDC090091 TaxID=3364081 RepID=UPI00381A55D5